MDLEISQDTSSSAWVALKLGVRSMLRHPWKACVFLILSLSQGALQGAFIVVLREMLIRFSDATAVTATLMLVAALAVFGVWILRSGATFLAQVASVQLSERVAVEMMYTVLGKLLQLPVRFFAKSQQGRQAMVV